MSSKSSTLQMNSQKRTVGLDPEDLSSVGQPVKKAQSDNNQMILYVNGQRDGPTSMLKAQQELGQQEPVCAVCFDYHARTEDFLCQHKCGTFTCWDCLLQSYKMATQPGAIQGGSNADGELLCSDVKCRSPIKVLDLAKCETSEEIVKALEDFKLHVHTTKMVTEALRQQEDQIRAEYARIEQIKDAEEKAAVKLRIKIVNEALTLRCPRCSAAFVDFDGCFAVRCGNNACGCGFCAWCLKDCGYDAHQHVRQCVENADRSGSYNAYYNSQAEFQKHHKQRRTTAVQRLVRDAELSTNTTEKLKELMKRDLEDLGIQLSDVFPAPTSSASSSSFTTAPQGSASAGLPAVIAAAAPVAMGAFARFVGLVGFAAPVRAPVPAAEGLDDMVRRADARRAVAPAAAAASDRVLRSAGPAEQAGRPKRNVRARQN